MRSAELNSSHATKKKQSYLREHNKDAKEKTVRLPCASRDFSSIITSIASYDQESKLTDPYLIMEAEGSGVQSHLLLHNKFNASLGYMRPCLKTQLNLG